MGFLLPFSRPGLGFTPIVYIAETLKLSVLESILDPAYLILAVLVEHIRTKTK